MAGTATRLRQIARRLDKLAPAEPLVIQIVYADDWRSDEPGDGRAQRVIQLRWPEDEDDEKRTRQDAPERA